MHLPDIATFFIDNKKFEINLKGSSHFVYGDRVRISNKDNDITTNLSWYKDGYQNFEFLNDNEFEQLYNGIQDCIVNILEKQQINTTNFTLEKYHHFVTTDLQHQQVVSVTRDLFPHDFNLSFNTAINRFETFLNTKLTDLHPETQQRFHIIIRINRPGSSDYNPPHKDIYEHWDKNEQINFINIWVPICGVTQHSSLPLVPGSHLLYEDQILRTTEGGIVEGKKYHVRTIREWADDTHLTRSNVTYKQALLFSPCLIHGLAVNDQTDTTRVALEFRLSKQ